LSLGFLVKILPRFVLKINKNRLQNFNITLGVQEENSVSCTFYLRKVIYECILQDTDFTKLQTSVKSSFTSTLADTRTLIRMC